MASSSNLSLVNFTHDVFVNYWPEDTGNNFTSHLKKAVTGAGFNVAMNDMIGEGKEISDTLLNQISESLISVVIFSKNYASSPDCLDELVKIIESQEENGRHVLPVFLGVEPSDVRKQTGAFGDGFHKLIQSEQFMEKKETWRSALMKTANLSGWHSAENSEVKMVEGIAKRIMGRILKILYGLRAGNSSNGFGRIYQLEAFESILKLLSKLNLPHVFTQQGSREVECILVDLSKATKDMYMMPEFFDKMSRLRVLKLHHVHDLFGKPSGGIKLHLPKGLRSLSNNLRYLRWDSYPLTSLPEKFTRPNHLVELWLRDSKVKQLWSEGAIQQPYLPMLECMHLSESKDLIKLPDFSKTPNLKTLEAGGCDSLIEIPSSIQHLSKLQSLQMGFCANLSKLPELPRSIVSLNFERTKIEELPSSIAYLSQLQILYLRDCKNLKSLPDLPSSLQELDADGCISLKIEDDYIFGSSLEEIHLCGTNLESLPRSIKYLSQLQMLLLSGCKNLKSLPDLPSSLQYLNANGCTSLKIEGGHIFGSSLIEIRLCNTDVESLPASIKHLSHLKVLSLFYCKNLKSLPDLPWSLQELDVEGCTSLTFVGNFFREDHFFGEDHCERL